MNPSNHDPLADEEVAQLRANWRPRDGLAAGYAASIVRLSMRRKRRRQVAAGALVVALAAMVFWPRNAADSPTAVLVSEQREPAVRAGATASNLPVAAEAPVVLPDAIVERSAETVETDLLDEAIAPKRESKAESKQRYRDSLGELGDEYEELAALYLDSDDL